MHETSDARDPDCAICGLLPYGACDWHAARALAKGRDDPREIRVEAADRQHRPDPEAEERDAA